jgi:hypothetical protein
VTSGVRGGNPSISKLALERIKFLWEGQAIPPVQPFYDHKSMLDELEE